MNRTALPIALLAISGCAPLAPQTERAQIHPTVLKLLLPDERQAAYEEILSWERRSCESEHDDGECPFGGPERADHVIVCPQRTGPPLFAVAQYSDTCQEIVLIDGDGTVIPLLPQCDSWHDELSDSVEIRDLNNDGVLEMIFAPPYGSSDESDWDCRVLHVVSISRRPRRLLSVAFEKRHSRWKDTYPMFWSWRVVEGPRPGVHDVELGICSILGTDVRPCVSYRWSDEAKGFLGPSGGYDQVFMRVKGDLERELERFTSAGFRDIDQAKNPVCKTREGQKELAAREVIFREAMTGYEDWEPSIVWFMDFGDGRDPPPSFIRRFADLGVEIHGISQAKLDQMNWAQPPGANTQARSVRAEILRWLSPNAADVYYRTEDTACRGMLVYRDGAWQFEQLIYCETD